MPLASATCRVHAPAASTTTGASIVLFAVVKPVTLPALMFTASALVFGSKVAPRAIVARAPASARSKSTFPTPACPDAQAKRDFQYRPCAARVCGQR
jgi:hypothetical protein